MSINTMNENIFKNHMDFYVLVDENRLGLLEFITNPRYKMNSSEPYLEYEGTFDVSLAYHIINGDPILEVVEELAPHLSLYKVNPTYEFEYVDTSILKGD